MNPSAKHSSSRRWLAVAALLLVTVPVYADFSAIANAMSSQRGVKRTWIPFLGVARTFVRVAKPEGIRDFQLAVFSGGERIDPRQLQTILGRKVGPGFTPLVQVRSRKSGEWSFIYARPYDGGNRVELLVLAHDSSETVLVRVDIDAEMVARHLNSEPRGVTAVARR
jgi:hypothetical protein